MSKGAFWKSQFKERPRKILKAATQSQLNTKIANAKKNGWIEKSEIKHFTGMSTAFQILMEYDMAQWKEGVRRESN